MGLKLKVKVSEVNNLSDARYCAGMGVDMLGFHLDENHPRFIDINTVKEITNWVHGVQVVGEFSASNIDNINYLAEELKLDFIELPVSFSPDDISKLQKAVILKLNLSKGSESDISEIIDQYSPFVEYFLLESEDSDSIEEIKSLLKIWNSSGKLLLGIGINKDSLPEIENSIKPAGIALKGGDEIKPGLKNFDELADILEELETE